MSRKLEKRILVVAAIWDICIGLITMFGYYPWVEEQGIGVLQDAQNYDYLSSSLVGMISKVVLIVGLATVLMGIISILQAKNMRKNEVDKGRTYWLIACVAIHLVIYDVVGIILYLVTSIIYFSKNKAINIVNVESSY